MEEQRDSRSCTERRGQGGDKSIHQIERLCLICVMLSGWCCARLGNVTSVVESVACSDSFGKGRASKQRRRTAQLSSRTRAPHLVALRRRRVPCLRRDLFLIRCAFVPSLLSGAFSAADAQLPLVATNAIIITINHTLVAFAPTRESEC